MRTRVIFASRKEGVSSLVWAVSFPALSLLLVPKTDYEGWVVGIWFFIWWMPSLPCAVSGLRKGVLVSRMCAAITLLAFTLLAWGMLTEFFRTR